MISSHPPKVRFALIGCGRIGATADDQAAKWLVGPGWLPLSHASAIAAVEEAELAAVCDVSADAARATKERFGAGAAYTDYEQMLAQVKPEAVAIATRTHERKAIIEACVRHGVRALFCEKPLSLTLEDADALTALLRDHDVAFVYATRRRYMPIFRRVKAALDRGAIGEVRTITIRFDLGQLLWVHPHSIDLACYFAGDVEPEFVQADLALDPALCSEGQIDADPLVRAAYLRFANGVAAHLVAAPSYDVEIGGSEGLVTIFSEGAEAEWRTRQDAGPGRIDIGTMAVRRKEHDLDDASGTVESIRALIAKLRGETVLPCDPMLARRNMEIIFGMAASHLDEGRRVHWPIARRGLKITGRTGDRYP